MIRDSLGLSMSLMMVTQDTRDLVLLSIFVGAESSGRRWHGILAAGPLILDSLSRGMISASQIGRTRTSTAFGLFRSSSSRSMQDPIVVNIGLCQNGTLCNLLG